LGSEKSSFPDRRESVIILGLRMLERLADLQEPPQVDSRNLRSVLELLT
jgi:hypothetical protein